MIRALIAAIMLFAVGASAFDPFDLPGWGNGNEVIRDAFYPPSTANPRIKIDGNWYWAHRVWAEDLRLALNERAYAAGHTLPPNELVSGWTNPAVRVYEWQKLAEIKAGTRELIENVQWLDLSHRSNGNYNAWYSQFSIAGYTNVSEWIAGENVSNPPAYTVDTILEYVSAPTNFFDYTPARFLGATSVSFTNEHTAAGGTNEWTTLDYGWGTMADVIMALEDLYFTHGTHRRPIQTFDLDCNGDLLDGVTTGTVSATVGGVLSVSFIWTDIRSIEAGEFGTNASPYESVYTSEGLNSSEARLGVSAQHDPVWLDYIQSLTESDFQWYHFSFQESEREWSVPDPDSSPSGQLVTTNALTNAFVHGFQLVYSTTAAALDGGDTVDSVISDQEWKKPPDDIKETRGEEAMFIYVDGDDYHGIIFSCWPEGFDQSEDVFPDGWSMEKENFSSGSVGGDIVGIWRPQMIYAAGDLPD